MFKLSAKKMILGIAAAGSSYVVGGAILDAVSNAVSQITWFATILGTVVTVLLWLALRISLPKYPIRWRNYRVKRLGYYPTCAFIGTALLLWTPPILNRVNYSSNQAEPEVAINNTQKEAKVVVLLADFAGADPGLYGVTKIIEEQLTEVTKDYRDVKIKRLFQSIDTSEVALIKGREAQADIVLWGSYFVNPSHTRVSAHFEVIEKTFEIPLRRDKEVITTKTAKLQSFSLQEQLSQKMSYLVLTTVGLIQIQELNYDGAITSLTNAMSLAKIPEQLIDPHHLYFYRGLSYLMKGMLDKALSDFSQAIGYRREADLFSMRGFIYILQVKPELALADFNSSLSIEDSDQVYGVRGFVYANFLDDPQRAMRDFNRAIELNPGSMDGRLNRSLLYVEKGDFESALADLNVVIRFEPTSNAYNNLGLIYERQGEIEKSIAAYTKGTEIDPNNVAAYFNRGNLYAKNHHLDKALTDANVAIILDPQFAKPYAIRGHCYEAKGNLDDAIKEFSKAIELKDDEASGDYYNIGRLYGKKGEYERAIEAYNRAIQLDRRFADAYGNRGVMHLDLGKFNDAISDCNKAIKLNPANSLYYTTRGGAWAAKRNFPRAMADLNKAISMDDKNITAYFNRATAYANLSKKSEAIIDYRRVVELGSEEFFVNLAKQNLCALEANNC